MEKSNQNYLDFAVLYQKWYNVQKTVELKSYNSTKKPIFQNGLLVYGRKKLCNTKSNLIVQT